MLVAFGLILVFQVAVLLGLVPTGMVWGGRLGSDEERTAMSLVSISLLVLMVGVVLIRTGRIGASVPAVGRLGMWCIVVLFALNTLGNLLAKDPLETILFTPVTLAMTLLAWRVAIGR